MLEQLGLLGSKADAQKAASAKWSDATPDSMQSIKAGVLGATRWFSKAVVPVGGTAGVAGLVAGFFKGAGGNTPIAVALVAGGSFVLAAVIIGLAILLYGDARARSIAAAARHTGRATVASAFLVSTAGLATGQVAQGENGQSASQRGYIHRHGG